MIIRNWLYRLIQMLQENRILACCSLPPIFLFNVPDFPKTKMRSRFMILCQPSLNDLPLIFSPPLLYKPPSPPFQSTKNPLSSPLLSSSEVEQSCHILIFLRLKVLSETYSPSPNSSFPPLLGPLPRVSSFIIQILHEGIIYFLNLLFVLS